MAALRTDILVVGGGLAGCAVAYFLSREGCDVTLIERHDINSLASGSNAGSLHAQIPFEPFLTEGEGWARQFAPVVTLLVQSIEMWRNLSEELGVDLEVSTAGGLLVAEHGGFEERVILAKIAKARFHFPAVPGDTLEYRTTIDDIQKDGAIVSGTSTVGDRLQGEVQLFFAHLNDASIAESLFDPANLLAMLQLLGVFKVGRDSQGGPLTVPKSLLNGSQPH